MNDPKIIFQDRSLEADKNTFAVMLYEKGCMSKMEWECYNKWNNIYEKYIKSNLKNIRHYIIYLRCNPETSFHRILKRNRPEESNTPMEYLQELNKYHDNWLLYRDDTIIIDANKDFLEDKDYFEKIYQRIYKIMNSYISS
jgi:deoxyadenosine/deoxycytidine kinase